MQQEREGESGERRVAKEGGKREHVPRAARGEGRRCRFRKMRLRTQKDEGWRKEVGLSEAEGGENESRGHKQGGGSRRKTKERQHHQD